MVVLDTYSITNRDTGTLMAPYPGNNGLVYQSFTTPDDGVNYKLTTATAALMKGGGATFTCQAEIYAHTGVYGTSSAPTGAALATSAVLTESSVTTDYSDVNFTFSGANQIILTPNTHYVLAIKMLTGSYLSAGYDGSSPTHGGNAGLWTSA